MGPLLSEHSVVATFLFTDIQGSTRLWEQEPERMRAALARHDAIARNAVESHHGRVVKMTGDGMHAVFDDPLDAIRATIQMQCALQEPQATNGLQLLARCGMHTGISERRDNDYFGTAVNRAARIMSAAHGGQILLSEAVATLIGEHPTGIELRDLGRVRLRDLTSPEHVYQLLHPKLRVDFPPLRSLEATPNNLPQQLTSFVGRERELAQARTLLARTRLLTLLGVGGLGKSRLSLQIGAEALEEFPDGVWLVELAAIADERLVPLSVATALGVKEDAGRPVQDALVKHVADRQLLIILDNCEHLISACAHVAKALLQAGAHVRILATSREALRIAGETTLQIPTLSVPEPDAPPALAELREVDAIRLFVDRASAADPGFHLDEHNAGAIIEICRRLDGIPLAIELAAARVRGLPVDRIAARLSDRFKLLTGGDRTALKRQQTLRALIDWSHDLLTPAERALFGRLSVFAGGWTLDAAEAVATDGNVAAGEVLDLLTRLIEKSLVAPDVDGARYRFLETIREYAGERLVASGEEGAVRMRHLEWYLAFVEAGRPQFVGPQLGAWLARLDAERENIFAAHRYCDRVAAGGELGMRLMSAIRRYWFDRGLLGLGYRTTIEALARPSAQAPTPVRAEALNHAGQIAAYMGRYAEAQAHLMESLAIARSLGDRQRVAFLLQPLALACLGVRDVDAAREYLKEALELARESGDRREIAAALNSLAQLARMEGDLETAEPLYQQVLDIGRDMPDVAAFSLLNLAMVAIGRDTSDRAREMLLDVIAICDEVDSKPTGQSVIEVSSGLAAACSDWEHAARFFGAAERQAAVSGIHRDPTDEAFLLPLIKRARAALDASTYADAEAAGRAMDYASAMTAVRAWLGTLATS